jgi:hypothetical protein
MRELVNCLSSLPKISPNSSVIGIEVIERTSYGFVPSIIESRIRDDIRAHIMIVTDMIISIQINGETRIRRRAGGNISTHSSRFVKNNLPNTPSIIGTPMMVGISRRVRLIADLLRVTHAVDLFIYIVVTIILTPLTAISPRIQRVPAIVIGESGN